MISGGRLVIRPGQLDYDTYVKIRHRAPTVEVVRTRVPLLLARTTVKLEGEDGTLAYVWPLFKRKRVLHALEQSGLEIVRRSSWLLPRVTTKT